MANRKNKKVEKPKYRGKRPKPRQRTRGAPKQSSSLGRMLCKGVQTLASLIPGYGAAIAKGLDFLFKSVGATKNAIVSKRTAQTVTEVEVYQLQAIFEPCVGSVLEGSRAIQVHYKPDGSIAYTTPYEEVRIRAMTIEVIPNNPIEKRAGELTLSYQPYFGKDDASSSTFTNVQALSQEAMRRQYLCTSGPADRLLSITYRPKVTDGWAYAFKPVTQPPNGVADALGQCCILYRNYARDSFTEFKPSEFHCQVIISSEIEARSPSGMPFVVDLKRRVIDLQTPATAYVISNGIPYTVSGDGSKVTANSLGSVDVFGIFQKAAQLSDDREDPPADFEMVGA